MDPDHDEEGLLAYSRLLLLIQSVALGALTASVTRANQTRLGKGSVSQSVITRSKPLMYSDQIV